MWPQTFDGRCCLCAAAQADNLKKYTGKHTLLFDSVYVRKLVRMDSVAASLVKWFGGVPLSASRFGAPYMIHDGQRILRSARVNFTMWSRSRISCLFRTYAHYVYVLQRLIRNGLRLAAAQPHLLNHSAVDSTFEIGLGSTSPICLLHNRFGYVQGHCWEQFLRMVHHVRNHTGWNNGWIVFLCEYVSHWNFDKLRACTLEFEPCHVDRQIRSYVPMPLK